MTISTGAVCGDWVNCWRRCLRRIPTRKEQAVETSPRVPPQQFAESMKQEFEEFAKQIMEAVNDAPDGQWIAGSEEPVRDLCAEMRRKIFERALQQRVDAAEAAFSPSAPSNDGKAVGQ